MCVFSCAIAIDFGLGLKVSSHKGGGAQNGTSVGDSGSGGEEDMEEDGGGQHVVRALYAFNGTNEDEVCIGPSSSLVSIKLTQSSILAVIIFKEVDQ